MGKNFSRVVAVIAGGATIAVMGSSVGYAAARITSADIVDGTIQGRDFSPATREVISRPGPQGPRGPQGPQGQPGQPGAPGNSSIVQVDDLNGEFKARSEDAAGVKMVGDGIQFGPFPNGGGCTTAGVDFGRLDYSGMNGENLSTLTSLVYEAFYVADTDTGGVGSPTMRVFYDDPSTTEENDRLTYSPNTQTNKAFNYDAEQGEVHTWMVTQGTVRVNDDGGNNPAGERPWSEYMQTLGNLKITNINILNGCQNGVNLRSVVRNIEVNGTTYDFGVLPTS